MFRWFRPGCNVYAGVSAPETSSVALQVTVMEGDTNQQVEVERFISRELKRDLIRFVCRVALTMFTVYVYLTVEIY